jgi:hypothetical protein
MPSVVRLKIALSTALTASSNLYIDHVAFTAPISFYRGGPNIAVFSGNINFISGDNYTLIPTNDYGGKFQILFDRFFNMKQLGLLLPSSNSPTILDSLIS